MKENNKVKYITKNNNNNSVNEIKINNILLKKRNFKIRMHYLDLLRIVSAFSVIIIHVSADYYYNLKINHQYWKITFYFNAIARFGVPVFFMISGTIFLSRNIPLRIILVKYNLRILIHLIVWSFIYSIYNIKLSKNNIDKIIKKFFSGHFHLWYLHSTIELYMISPFLRELVKTNLLKDLIKLSFIFSFLLRNLIDLKLYYPKILTTIFDNIYSKFNFEKFKGNIFYFMLGYYINSKKDFGIINLNLIYFLGILGFLFTTLILYNICIINHKKLLIYFNNFNLNILFYSTGIFVFFKEKFNNLSLNKKTILKRISNYTFGIYLIHPLILDKIVNTMNFSYFILLIPLKSIITFILSFLICVIFKNIPFFGEYIV